ncbi:transcription termination factor NusA [Candidatus Saccharibacteria bacterium]|nr:transcription termination factor NusA [Candidatus Saccharibacteria bacterium]
MESLDIKQMVSMIKVIAEEKNLPEDVVFEIIEAAIAAAWRRDNGEKDQNVRAELNVNSGEADVYVMHTVVEDDVAYNPANEIPLKDAKAIKKTAKVDDVLEEKHKVATIGRVAAQTAKQVVIHRLKEAEKEIMLAAYADKVGQVVNGTILRVEPRVVQVDLGRATGIMPQSEQIPGEYYSVGARTRVFIKEIDREGLKGPQLILSRGAPEFVEYLFRQEVPEIENDTVEIKSIAREAGFRTKIAVISNVPGVDPVGTFVGGRGVRVQAVMNEIGDREKIDIVTWSDNPSEFIREALSPAEIAKVEIGKDSEAKVFVTEDQQSIAIGRSGQNVRLAGRLTGYKLDIELVKKSVSKPRKNVEDSLLSAIEEVESNEETEKPAKK